MAEGGMTEVMGQGQSFYEIFIQVEAAGDPPSDRNNFV